MTPFSDTMFYLFSFHDDQSLYEVCIAFGKVDTQFSLSK